MGAEEIPLKDRVKDLAEEVRTLTSRVDELALRVDSLSERWAARRGGESRHGEEAPRDIPALAGQPARASDAEAEVLELNFWPGASRTGLLSAIATVSFLLVVALILRTITENGLLDLRGGSLLGMGYAVALMGCGWGLLVQRRSMGPIFAVSGTVLILFMVLETHERFRVLPTEAAFPVLVVVTLGMGLLGLRRELPALLAVTVLGASIAAVFLDFRGASPPWASSVLLVANVFAYKASRVRGGTFLRWCVFAITLLYAVDWILQIRAPASARVHPDAKKLYLWLPAIACAFTVTFAWLVVRRAGRRRTALGAFDAVVVVVSILGTHAVAQAVLTTSTEAASWIALVSSSAAAGLLGLSVWLARGGVGGILAVGTFSTAGVSLWLIATGFWQDGSLVGIGLWAAAALAAALLAISLGPVFLWTAYVVEVAAVLLAAAGGSMAVPAEAPGAAVGTFALLAALGLLHHLWLRRHGGADVADSESPASLAAVVPFVASLAFLFGGTRVALYQALSAFGPAAADAFGCAQSVVINLGAAVLALVASLRRTREIFAVAVGVGCIGAVKVFAFDLIQAHGIPLVLSVLSFGLATAVGSFALRRLSSRGPESASSSGGAGAASG